MELALTKKSSLGEIRQRVLKRDPLCIWCLYIKYMQDPTHVVRPSTQAHHVIKKAHFAKRNKKLLDVENNLVGVCEYCHYARLVDNYEAVCYFFWYLTRHCGYDMNKWYEELPLICKENIIDWWKGD